MRIELTCREYGGNRFTLGRALEDASQVACEDCGHEIGTLARLKQEVAAQVVKQTRAADRSVR